MLHALASLLIYTVVAVFGTSANHAIPSKNRVWNFFSYASVFVGKNKSQVLESQQEKTLCAENVSSGMPEYRARYYDPQMGRFLSEDPIGFKAGDFNKNRYVGNSPYRFLDPKGKSSFTELASLYKLEITVASAFAYGAFGNAKAAVQSGCGINDTILLTFEGGFTSAWLALLAIAVVDTSPIIASVGGGKAITAIVTYYKGKIETSYIETECKRGR